MDAKLCIKEEKPDVEHFVKTENEEIIDGNIYEDTAIKNEDTDIDTSEESIKDTYKCGIEQPTDIAEDPLAIRWSNHYCCVPNCKSWSKKHKNVSFHVFPPKDEIVKIKLLSDNFDTFNRRKLWIHRLRIGKKVSKYMKVCSLHFTENDYFKGNTHRQRLKKTAIPSLRLPLVSKMKTKRLETAKSGCAVVDFNKSVKKQSLSVNGENDQITDNKHSLYLTDNDKPYACDFCHKQFSHQCYLKKHLKIHSGVKPYECNVCHKQFLRKQALTLHLKLHIDDKPYECGICHKKYVTNARLKGHLKVHPSIQPYECGTCPSKFTTKRTLHAHIKLHNEQSFECGTCQSKFITKRSLHAHIKVHDKKPFECGTCCKKFSFYSRLKLHLKVHNNKKT